MTHDERDALRVEWRRLNGIEAKVVELHRLRDRGNGRSARWLVTIESALGRRETVIASTAALAMRRAVRRLGYRVSGAALVLDSERPTQVSLS